MSSDGMDTGKRTEPETAGEEHTVEPTLALVRAYGQRPPYDHVDWTALRQRIVAGAAGELERLRTEAVRPSVVAGAVEGHDHARGRLAVPSLRESSGRPTGRRMRSWWEVTAGWARPVAVAAAATIVIAAALVVGTSATGVVGQGANAVASLTSMATSVDGVEAQLLEPATATPAENEASSTTPDSLFAAIVNTR